MTKFKIPEDEVVKATESAMTPRDEVNCVSTTQPSMQMKPLSS